MIGTTVSHYKILEKIGGGGMGIVYRAHDLKLDRVVALKFLPSELTLDPEAKERFIHEAKAASSLQHHNICTIHDIDQTDDGQMFIVMDLYEGETLKSRIGKGNLRIEEATDIAIQIAQGLAEAHEHGIVHRDIKPANILITKNGIVKIVDFGLAKLGGASKLTKTGSTLGTVAYMAPEQLQGSDVDARADIFSVGVVLYEMLTGKTPFRGDHEAALMYSILNEEPEPLQTHIPDVASELIHVVSRALEKDPANRYKTMDDLLIDLRRVRKETSKVSMPALTRKKPPFLRSRLVLVVASAVVCAGVLITVFFLYQPRNLPEPNPDAKLSVVPFSVKNVNYSTLSHDGNWIAFAGSNEIGKWDIYYMNSTGGAVRRVTFDSTGLTYAEDCSRNGEWILYVRQTGALREIAAVPALGGPVRRIVAGVEARFLPMSDKILYLKGVYSGAPTKSGKLEIGSINLDGSDDRVVFVDPGYTREAEGVSWSFAVSPDGRSIAWIKTFQDFSQDIITYDLETGKERQVTFSRTPKDEVQWTKSNYLIYSAYASGNYDLWMCPAEGGNQLQLSRSRNDEMRGILSDDGSKLLYFEQNLSGNVRSMDLATGKVTSITSDDRNRESLCISSDKRYVAYTPVPSYMNRLTRQGIQVVDANGVEPLRAVCADERNMGAKSWSPDGKWIAYTRPPDTVNGAIRVCIVSPFTGNRSRVIAEVKGPPFVDIYLRWHNQDTLSWFSEMKTWICGIDNPRPAQFYEDSTRARRIQDGKYVLYADRRVGRQGWWIDTAPTKGSMGNEATRRRLVSSAVAIAPRGDYLLHSPKPNEIHRVSLPDGKDTRLPFVWPSGALSPAITQDGQSVVYIERVSNSKLMLWENPFLKE